MHYGKNLVGLAKALRQCLYCLVLLTFLGCANHVQRQLFCVKDPNTGAANYYCLTVYGSSLLSKYNFQAGYFSSAAVDVLRGDTPTVPELDLPVERITNYDRLLNYIDQDVWQEAKIVAPVTDPDILAGNELDRMKQAQKDELEISAQIDQANARYQDSSNKLFQAQSKTNQDWTAITNANVKLANIRNDLNWFHANASSIITNNLNSVQTNIATVASNLTSWLAANKTVTPSNVTTSNATNTASGIAKIFGRLAFWSKSKQTTAGASNATSASVAIGTNTPTPPPAPDTTVTSANSPAPNVPKTASSSSVVMAMSGLLDSDSCKSNLNTVVTAMDAAINSYKQTSLAEPTNFGSYPLLSLSNFKQAAVSGGLALTNIQVALSNSAKFVGTYTNTNPIELSASQVVSQVEHSLEKATNDLVSAIQPITKIVSVLEGAPTNNANTFSDALQNKLSQQQTNVQSAEKTFENDKAAIALAQAEVTNTLANIGSLQISQSFAIETQTNAANAARKFQDAAMTLKLARVPGQGTNYVQHIPESVHFQDNYEFRYIMLARLLWFTSLSGADIVSVGMSQSDNPQQFRKLVFWAKSKTEDLQSVSSDVDNIIQQVTTIGDSYKQMAADRQAAAAIAKTNDVVRAMAAKKALNAIIAGSNNVTAESIIDLLEPASSTNQPAVTKQ